MTSPTAGDQRRATALTVWYGHLDLDGVNSVLQEAAELDRVRQLVIGILDLHAHVIPILLTDDGLACLSQMVYSLSEGREGDDPDCARSARLIIAHADRDLDAYKAVLQEAADADRVTETIVGILGTFRAFVPLLYSELGLAVLQRSILDWAAREDDAS
ncbi:MAG: hypothetical protein K0U76_03855 [Actinomycetia bacterium]|nr:hypothetical protein [Actinomycetes bacterium]MCH9700514.1 hypothetical protein [Actinomycetes bacterium]MCH9759188.1 hypothetical protein [Actinomycetes bacterium]